jgi:CubicO group peptidase (beta-lactamase class C family)
MRTTRDFSALHEQIEAVMRDLHVPGVAVGLIHAGQEHTAGFGITNVNHRLPVTADTLFQIGSITKTFVGTLAMRLVELDKLDLDRPLREYLPELRLKDADALARATMRTCLTHTGGWFGDYFDDTGNGDDALAEIVRRMADLEQIVPINTVWSYNNAGFYLAGRVIEVIIGQTFEQAMREHILDPLGMGMSFFLPADVMVHRCAVGHNVYDGEPRVATPWPLARAANAAGGITSTVNDMLTYARFQLADGLAADGSRLLAAESLHEMRAPQYAIDTFGNYVGIAWMLRNLEGTPVITHTGGTNGQISLFLVALEAGFALVMLTNANSGRELTNRIARWAIREYLGTREPELPRIKIGVAELERYAGSYQGQPEDLELRVEDGALMLRTIPRGGFPKRDSPPGPTPPPVRLRFIGQDQVLCLDAPMQDVRGEFLRDEQGDITWFRLGSRIARRQT